MSDDPLEPHVDQPNRPQPELFQFSLARILIALTIAAVLLGVAGMFAERTTQIWLWLGIVVLLVLFVDMSYFYVQYGNYAYTNENLVGAAYWYDRARRASPSNAELHTAHGIVQQRLGNMESARRDFVQATHLQPRMPRAWESRCTVELSLREFEAAVASASMALVLSPDSATALLVRGVGYYVLAEFEKSLEDLDELIRLNPDFGEAYRWRGCVHSIQGRPEIALDNYEQALAHGCDEFVHVERSDALFRMRRYDEAFREMEAFMDRDVGAGWSLLALSRFLSCCPDARFRDGERALRLCREAEDRSEIEAWTMDAAFAAAYAELGRFDEAIHHGERAAAGAPPYRKEEYCKRLEAYRCRRAWRE